jgi:hypothetical protein
VGASKPLTKREKELYFCLNRIEQYWMKLTERLDKRKISKKKAELFYIKLDQWEEKTDLMLLMGNPRIQK